MNFIITIIVTTNAQAVNVNVGDNGNIINCNFKLTAECVYT
jgi:hypothetical protein